MGVPLNRILCFLDKYPSFLGGNKALYYFLTGQDIPGLSQTIFTLALKSASSLGNLRFLVEGGIQKPRSVHCVICYRASSLMGPLSKKRPRKHICVYVYVRMHIFTFTYIYTCIRTNMYIYFCIIVSIISIVYLKKET